MKIRAGESEKMEGERRSGKLVECAAARRRNLRGQARSQAGRRAKRQESKETGEQRERPMRERSTKKIRR